MCFCDWVFKKKKFKKFVQKNNKTLFKLINFNLQSYLQDFVQLVRFE
jgi:hypothetical protein